MISPIIGNGITKLNMKKNLIALLVTTIFIAPVMATSPDAPAAAESVPAVVKPKNKITNFVHEVERLAAESVQAVKSKTKAVVKLAKANKAPMKNSIADPVDPIKNSIEDPVDQMKNSIEDPVDPMKNSIEDPVEPISPTF
jgi:hypothetical protein